MTEEPASPDLGRWLQRHHEDMIRNSLALIVERSSLEELGARPLGDWIGELRERLTAERPPAPSATDDDGAEAGQGGAQGERAPGGGAAVTSSDSGGPDREEPAHRAAPPYRPRSGELAAALGLRPLGGGPESFATAVEHRAALERRLAAELAEHRPSQRPYTLALLHPGERSAESGEPAAPPEGWTEAVRAAAEDPDAVLDAGFGVTAVLLPRSGPLGARATLDALRVAAWRRLGERGPLPEAGLATYPDDGRSAGAVVACALNRLGRNTDATLRAPDEG